MEAKKKKFLFNTLRSRKQLFFSLFLITALGSTKLHATSIPTVDEIRKTFQALSKGTWDPKNSAFKKNLEAANKLMDKLSRAINENLNKDAKRDIERKIVTITYDVYTDFNQLISNLKVFMHEHHAKKSGMRSQTCKAIGSKITAIHQKLEINYLQLKTLMSENKIEQKKVSSLFKKDFAKTLEVLKVATLAIGNLAHTKLGNIQNICQPIIGREQEQMYEQQQRMQEAAQQQQYDGHEDASDNEDNARE